jgi:hypothetical protein
MARHQKLPTEWTQREKLREKGQFWTPMWVAEAMVSYVSQPRCSSIFDPAVGAGAFFQAARNILGSEIKLRGTEVDESALNQAKEHGFTADDLKDVSILNFMELPASQQYASIVANPPYIRHHRIPLDKKAELKLFVKQFTGLSLDGRAGFHVYFFLKALSHLAAAGALAFIMPADTCEGVFADKLWRWITEHFCLEYVVTFAPEATPFPGVDTNAVVFCIRKKTPRPTLKWVRCFSTHGFHLRKVLNGGEPDGVNVQIQKRTLDEALCSGLSRARIEEAVDEVPLSAIARVVRGIATGANDFFFMSRENARQRRIPEKYFVKAIGRTRDIVKDSITEQDVEVLEKSGRATRLLMLNGFEFEDLPASVRQYILKGEENRLHLRALIAMRKPWYRMETRIPPPFLFAYLGRRSARFIRNTAGVVPLTGFLCVYPAKGFERQIENVWRALSDPRTLANLGRVGKSYGSGAIKVEPRSLERLPIPMQVLSEYDLTPNKPAQLAIGVDVDQEYRDEILISHR